MTRTIPEASARYFRSIARRGPQLAELSVDLVAGIEAVREEIRAEEGGGGYCHLVTEVLQKRYGWERLFVTYLSEAGEIVCGGGHVVNILPDGSVLDPTRDQFGEGHSVSLVSVNSPEIGRYRPEFHEDFHPGHPDVGGGVLDAWKANYPGMIDTDVDAALTAQKGDGWWLADRMAYDVYLARQNEYKREYDRRIAAARKPDGSGGP